MRKSMFWVSTILAFGLASSQMILAQERNGLDGVWQVNVTVVDCTAGAPVRTVGSLQMFRHDGTFIETANGSNRGISEGVWHSAGWKTFDAVYWFYRYTATGTFASLAKSTDKITLGEDGQFTASGLIQDFDATGALISTDCYTHTAKRLTAPEW